MDEDYTVDKTVPYGWGSRKASEYTEMDDNPNRPKTHDWKVFQLEELHAKQGAKYSTDVAKGLPAGWSKRENTRTLPVSGEWYLINCLS